ncbi:MAG: hypothetical protein H0W82_03640 [Actinobacteria bacterium]|nr:hypothetical protein [Actinomycetota bacterium]
MSMHEAICPMCGAINHADADTCWRCLGEVHGVVRAVAGRTGEPTTG